MKSLWRREAKQPEPTGKSEPGGVEDPTPPDASGLSGVRVEQDAVESVPGERGIPSVNRARSLQSRVSSALAVGLMAVLGLGMLTWYYAGTFTRQSRAAERVQTASRTRAQGDLPLPALGRIESPRVEAPPIVEQVLGPPPEMPPAANETAAVASVAPAAGPTPGQRAFERRLSGPAFVRQSDSTITETSGVPTGETTSSQASFPVGDTREAGTASRAASPPESVDTLLEPAVTPAVQARVLPTQRLLLAKGAFIDCTLETAIDSTLPGMTTCITATDTFSVDGKVVLLERGTKLVGETRGQVQQGMARLFVLWSEARTPTGVVVPLASPGTDELGRSGLAGTVDRHFWDRFGAAILISMIDGAVQSAAQSARDGGGTVIYNPSASQDIMTEVLKSTVNISPTLSKPQGDRIQVLVARDLDFRSVYQLRSTAGHGR